MTFEDEDAAFRFLACLGYAWDKDARNYRLDRVEQDCVLFSTRAEIVPETADAPVTVRIF